MPLTWILLESKSTVDLITNPKMLVNTSKVQGKDAIRVHCNSGVNTLERVGDLPGYGTVWYKLTGIVNTLLMSRATKKPRVVFGSEGGNFQDGPPKQGSKVSANPQRAILF